MEKRPFGKTGAQISVLGFGGAPVGYLETERPRVARLLNELLDAGVNLVDTGASYRGSEELIADTIGHRRDEFFLVSKCGGALDDIDQPEWTPALISQTVDRSLRRLRTDRLDLMLLHTCSLEVLQAGEVVSALLAARDAGKVRFIGYSGDNDAAAYAAARPEFAVVQTSVNLADQHNLDVVLPVAQANNVGVMAKRPLANAAWRSLDEQRGIYREYAKDYTARLSAMRLSLAELGVATWNELALRFTLSQPGVTTAIVGTTNPENARANVAAAAKGPLPEPTLAAIRAAFRRADPERRWVGLT
ncbi:MAG TPA: aldo/keto reductase [Candidatus Synoicihabitans sp.]|nr:aldo/keto reductase [Candidatus Synoicihabitans sp.]